MRFLNHHSFLQLIDCNGDVNHFSDYHKVLYQLILWTFHYFSKSFFSTQIQIFLLCYPKSTCYKISFVPIYGTLSKIYTIETHVSHVYRLRYGLTLGEKVNIRKKKITGNFNCVIFEICRQIIIYSADQKLLGSCISFATSLCHAVRFTLVVYSRMYWTKDSPVVDIGHGHQKMLSAMRI